MDQAAALYEQFSRHRRGGSPTRGARAKGMHSPSLSRARSPPRRTEPLPPLTKTSADEPDFREVRRLELRTRREAVILHRVEYQVAREEREGRVEIDIEEKQAFHHMQREHLRAMLVLVPTAAHHQQNASSSSVGPSPVTPSSGPQGSALRAARGSARRHGSASPMDASASGTLNPLDLTVSIYSGSAHSTRQAPARPARLARPSRRLTSPRRADVPTQLVYECRLTAVREAQERAAIDASWTDGVHWLMQQEIRMRSVALERAKQAQIQQMDALRRRAEDAVTLVASAIGAATMRMRTSYELAAEVTTDVLREAVRASRQAQLQSPKKRQ